MTTRIITEILCILVLLGLIGWDIYCMCTPTQGDTISEVIREANVATGGLIALGVAALWIHWFGPKIW